MNELLMPISNDEYKNKVNIRFNNILDGFDLFKNFTLEAKNVEDGENKIIEFVENIFEDGEWAILEWKDPLGLRGCGFFHIKNNLIVYQRGYWDKLSFLKQHNLPIE